MEGLLNGGKVTGMSEPTATVHSREEAIPIRVIIKEHLSDIFMSTKQLEKRNHKW